MAVQGRVARPHLTLEKVVLCLLVFVQGAGIVLGPAPSHAQPAFPPADCDRDGVVGIADLITAVDLALLRGRLEKCSSADTNGDEIVSVDELVGAVGSALVNCPRLSEGQSVTGSCRVPGPSGLEPCPRAFVVRVFGCTAAEGCLAMVGLSRNSSRICLAETAVGPDGAFTAFIREDAPGRNRLVVEANVDQAVLYRTLSFGLLGATPRAATAPGTTAPANAGSGVGLVDVAIGPIDPSTEAAVRLIDAGGLEDYIEQTIPDILDAVRSANAQTDFSALGAENAVSVAAGVAGVNLTALDELEANRVLRSGIPLDAEFQFGGDVDLFAFANAAPGRVILRAQAFAGIVTCIEVSAEPEGPVLEGGAACGASPVVDLVQLPAGEYFVRMTEQTGATGAYRLLLETAPMATATNTSGATATRSPNATATPTSTPMGPTHSPEAETATPSRTPTNTRTRTPAQTATATAVPQRGLSLMPRVVAVAPGVQRTVQVFLDAVASETTTLVVTLDNLGVATLSPDPLVIEAGETSAALTVTGQAIGTVVFSLVNESRSASGTIFVSSPRSPGRSFAPPVSIRVEPGAQSAVAPGVSVRISE